MPDEEQTAPSNDEKEPSPQALEPENPEATGEPEADPVEEPTPTPSEQRGSARLKTWAPAALALGGLAVGVAAVLISRSPRTPPQLPKAATDRAAQVAVEVAASIGDAAKRNSPVQHMVQAYSRQQAYGVGRQLRKMVEIAQYSRGAAH